MEAYDIKLEHRPFLERLKTKISEFKIDLNSNNSNQNEWENDEHRGQEIARTNSMLVRFQTIRKDTKVSSATRSNTVNIMARNFRKRAVKELVNAEAQVE